MTRFYMEWNYLLGLKLVEASEKNNRGSPKMGAFMWRECFLKNLINMDRRLGPMKCIFPMRMYHIFLRSSSRLESGFPYKERNC